MGSMRWVVTHTSVQMGFSQVCPTHQAPECRAQNDSDPHPVLVPWVLGRTSRGYWWGRGQRVAPNRSNATNRDDKRARCREALEELDWLLGVRGKYALDRGTAGGFGRGQRGAG